MEEPRFKIAEIALEKDGTYWLKWIGAHPDQGGVTYRWGAIGFRSIEDVGNAVTEFLRRERDEHLTRIKARLEFLEKFNATTTDDGN